MAKKYPNLYVSMVVNAGYVLTMLRATQALIDVIIFYRSTTCQNIFSKESQGFSGHSQGTVE